MSEIILIDPKGYSELKSLLGDNLGGLIDQFDQQSNQLEVELTRIVNEESGSACHEQLARQLHILKGSASSLHCPALFTMCEDFGALLSNDTASDATAVAKKTVNTKADTIKTATTKSWLKNKLDELLGCLHQTRQALRDQVARDQVSSRL